MVAVTTAVVLPLTAASVASPAQAAAGNPGVPGAPTVLYQENFENGVGVTNLPNYVGSTGVTYTADPYWLSTPNCNGFITSYSLPQPDPGTQTYCGGADQYANVQNKAYALGLLNNPQNPTTNRALSTNSNEINSPYVQNQIEFETSGQIPLASASGRFITFGVDAAATYCPNANGNDPTAKDPLLRFYFRNAAGTEIPVSTSPIDPCANPQQVVTVANPVPSNSVVDVGRYAANSSLLFTGTSLGIVLRNEATSSSGNDGAIDNIRVLDVTPQLDKAFSSTTIHPGQTSTLTFTITNTSELAAKNGWSFTDNLPAGVSIATPTAATTTCTGGAVAATTGGTSLQVTGNLDAGQASCTASVQVTATALGSYTNGPGNVTSTGLNPPGPTTLNVIPTPTITVVKNVAGRADASDQFTVGLNNAAGATLAAATTTGTATTASTAATPVADNTAYTVTDTTTAGSADPISAYTATISCIDTATNTAVPTSGTGPWTVISTNSDPITCTVTNTPQARSFSVVKTASETTAHPGDTVNYSVTVTNTGPVPYTAANPASFTDNLTGVLDDAVYNNDGAATGNGASTGTVAYAAPNLTWSGPLAVGATTTITYSVTVTDPDNGDHSLANVVTTPPNSGGGCPAGSTAAGCSTTTPVQSFRAVKTVTSPTNGAPAPGDTVTYSVLVTNTGQAAYTAANPASFTDNLSGVLDDATYNNNATATPGTGAGGTGGTGGTVTYAAPTLTWSGPLAVGASVTVTYSVTIDNPDTGDKTLTNAVVTPAGSGGNCATGSTDPSCTANLPTKSFTTTKSASKTSVVPGDTVTYTVQVTNTGQAAYTAANPASFTDNLTGVLDDATYNGDATITTGASGGSGGAVTYAAPTLTWTGPLPVGATVTVTYSVTVDNPDGGDKILANAITSPPGSGGSCVSGSTATGCTTRTPVQSYSTVKTTGTGTATSTGTVPGGKVTYTVQVTNTGQAAYTAANPASFTDSLSGVLDDATYNGDATAVVTTSGAGGGAPGSPAGTVTYTAPTLTWTGPLPVGGSVTVTYSVTVNNPDTGDAHLANTVVTPPGSGGACPTGSTDPACTANVPVARLDIVKSADPGTITAAGQPIRYSFQVTNTGNVTLTDITVAEGAFSGTGTLSAPACPAAAASLTPGASVTCTATYSPTQADIDAGGVTNTATAGGTPPGGNPPITSPPSTAKVTAPPAPGITVVKTADTTTITTVGQTVTYSFAVTNTGNVTLTNVKPVEGTFTGHGTLSAITCPTAANTVAPAATVTCTATYTVVAADLNSGTGGTGQTLSNTATATGTPPDPTTPTPTSPPSTVTIPTTPPANNGTGNTGNTGGGSPGSPASSVRGPSRLAYTGAELPLAVTTGAGLTLIAAGMLLIASCRRRRITD